MLQSSTIRFLKNIRINNNKPWMDSHRAAYDAARADYTVFIQKLIDTHGKKDPSIGTLLAKDCLFRINRDIRFAKDKRPYKTNLGASINKGGRKGLATAGYYIHLEPGKSFAGGGIWMPEPELLRKIRQEIDYNFPEFKKITGTSKFQKTYGHLDDSPEYKLSRIPKGYEADNPAAEYLKLKSFVATMHIDDALLTDTKLLKTVTDAFSALQPLIEFINEGVEV